jgi:hypothetical protein
MPISIEDRADYPLPPEKVTKEMSITVALRRVVDDLFTIKAVAEKLQGTEGDQQVEALMGHHKQILAEHLEETAWRGIDEFLARLDNLQVQPGLPLSPSPDHQDELDSRVG